MRFRSISLGILVLYTISCSRQKEQQADQTSPICIIGAFQEEITLLEAGLVNKKILNLEGIKVSTGELEGRKVVLAYTGMGKVNAAMVTGLLIHHFDPDQVIFTGIAGGINPDLHPADMVIAEQCVQHDLVRVYRDSLALFRVNSPIDGTINPIFFKSDSTLLTRAHRIAENILFDPIIFGGDTLVPRIFFGTLATGDAFIASSVKSQELRSRFNADAVEMEGAAVAQVCYQLGVPFIIIRSMSDSADEGAEGDLAAFYRLAARNSNLLVMELLKMAAD